MVMLDKITRIKELEISLQQSMDVMRYIIKYDPDAIAIYDNDLNYIAVSDRYLQDYNIQIENIIGKHHYEVFPELPQRWKDVHQRVLAGAIERNENDSFEHPDGSITYNRWECRPWYHADGSIGGIITYTEVTTERKLLENALHATEKKYRDLYENMMDAFVLVNMDGKIIEANEAYVNLVGYPREELSSLTYFNLTPEKWHKLESKIVADQVIPRGYSEVYEKEYRRKDGAIVPIEIRSNLICNEKGENFGIWAIIRDITERKKTEMEIQSLNESLEFQIELRTMQLKNANKELESFSYSVSHDLRAPLRAMDGFSLAVLEDYGPKLDDTGKSYLRRIREASQKMANLIDAMLALSRVTKAEISATEVNLSIIAETIASELHDQNLNRNVTWIIHTDLMAYGDTTLLTNVMGNLIGNAWKFTSKNSAATIEIGSVLLDDEKVFFIKDDGSGFEMEYATKLFAAFQRMHTQVEFEGTGVGLATVKRIINKHGGRIWAQAKPDEGATFFFTIKSME